MNKYQLAAIKNFDYKCITVKTEDNKKTNFRDLKDEEIRIIFRNKAERAKCERLADSITIYQRDDIYDLKYILLVSSASLSNCQVVYSDKSIKDAICVDNNYAIEIDFENPTVVAIKLNIINDYVEPIMIDIAYVAADKESYYEKKAAEEKKLLCETAAISHATGIDLVNIYFQPCSGDYARTEISLFRVGDKTQYRLLAVYKIDEDVYFKAINQLAFGEYSYVVKQFDKNDVLLLQTDYIRFNIIRRDYSGKPVVVI